MSDEKEFVDIAHFVSLRKVGGVERCYAELINTPLPAPVRHHTILPRPRIARPLAASIAAGSSSIRSLKRWGRLPLPAHPRFLRAKNTRRIFQRIRPHAVLFWNTPTGILLDGMETIQAPAVYYEHGASWYKNDAAVMRKALGRYRAIIANSRAAKRVIELRWGERYGGITHVCLNAVRPGCVPSPGGPRELPVARPVRLGIAGRLEPVKGFPLIIHALARLKRSGIFPELHMAGTGSERHRLRSLAHELGVEKQVHFWGFQANMNPFFSTIDLFLCPSLREPFGLVCAEALAHGIPVIASRIDGLAEVVVHGRTGLLVDPVLPVSQYPRYGGVREGLPPFAYDPLTDALSELRFPDPEALAAAVRRLVEDPDTYKQMSEEAQKVCREKFRFQSYAEKLQNTLFACMD
jgi:glycosyltransferase involved in cell wall biosynthesis